MNCLIARYAGIAYFDCMQYTLRNVPAPVDRALRALARREGKSLNEVLIQALARGVGASDEPAQYRRLRDLAGTWQDDPEIDAALADQDRIDETLWR